MPICKKCNSSFNARPLIDGQYKWLRHRVYCLKCSPFNSNRNKKSSNIQITCSICSKKYSYKRGGNSHTRCGSCCANSRRHNKKKLAIEYKGGKCIICGYSKCFQALSFHHLDPKNKHFTISGKHCLSFEKLKIELDKCVLLCANCHMEIEAGITKIP